MTRYKKVALLMAVVMTAGSVLGTPQMTLANEEPEIVVEDEVEMEQTNSKIEIEETEAPEEAPESETKFAPEKPETETMGKTDLSQNEEKEYLVEFKQTQKAARMVDIYLESAQNESSDPYLDKNNIVVREMTASEAEALKQNQAVAAVEENVTLSASAAPYEKTQVQKSTAEASEQSEPTEPEWNRRIIHADNPQSFGQAERAPKIAVIDSGVEPTVDITVAESINLVPGEEEVADFSLDMTKHGTAVAGLIAAKDNQIGITGVNPNAQIYSAKVLDALNQAPLSRVVEGIYWAIEQDVDIICLSLGTPSYSQILKNAVAEAYQSGILVIAAAGNNGDSGAPAVEYPAAYPEVIAVGSIDSLGERAEDSSFGPELELMAPGECVKASGAFQGVSVVAGTSMAVSHVAGVASILWQKDFSKSNEFIRGLLKAGANPIGEKQYYGEGLIDLQYCQDVYQEYEEAYVEGQPESSKLAVPENQTVVDAEETGYVEGRWGKNAHIDFVTQGKEDVEYLESGLGYATVGSYIADLFMGNGSGEECPYMHANKTNYVVVYSYLYKLSSSYYSNGDAAFTKVAIPSKGAKDIEVCKTMVSELKKRILTPWANRSNKDLNKLLPDAKTNVRTSHLLLGLAIHVLTDSFAHRSKMKIGEKWTSAGHNKVGDSVDQTSYYPHRAEAAYAAVRDALQCRKDNDVALGASSYVFWQPDVATYGGNKEGNFRMAYLAYFTKRNIGDEYGRELVNCSLLYNEVDNSYYPQTAY